MLDTVRIAQYFKVQVPNKTGEAALLPGTPRFNVERLHVEILQPVADGVAGELGPMVRVPRLRTKAGGPRTGIPFTHASAPIFRSMSHTAHIHQHGDNTDLLAASHNRNSDNELDALLSEQPGSGLTHPVGA